MKSWPALLVACLAALMLVPTACGDPEEGDADTDVDSDTDSDTDSDSDSDSDTDFTLSVQRIYDDIAYLASDELQGRYPGFDGNEQALLYVEALFDELGLQPVGENDSYRQAFTFAGTSGSIETFNLLAAAAGTDPDIGDEVIVIGAHIDHLGKDGSDIYNGADDNASGTAVMMELARALAAKVPQPKRTVLFASWNAEEEGLLGSCYYVDNPVYNLSDTIVKISVDMEGTGDGIGLTLWGGTSDGHRWIGDVMKGSAKQRRLGYQVFPSGDTGRSDHECFVDPGGVPAVLASAMCIQVEQYQCWCCYHTPDDTIDTMNLESLTASVELLWAFLEPTARGEEQRYLTE